MFNFAHGANVAKEDSTELILFALGSLAIGLLVGYVLGKSQRANAKPTKAPVKKSK